MEGGKRTPTKHYTARKESEKKISIFITFHSRVECGGDVIGGECIT
jgi:hypothetical protein